MLKIKNFIRLLYWYKRLRPVGISFENFIDSNRFEWYKNERKKLLPFKDIHDGEDCFIIGNGPSLNQMDLSKLAGYHLIGLNKINLIFEKIKLELSYHVAVNPLVIDQLTEEIKKNIFNCPSFLSYHNSKGIDFNKNVLKIETSNKWSFYEDITNPISEGYTVTFVAMQIAFYMGFKNIFLIGVDHNFSQKGNPNESQFLDKDDENHFHPDYFKGQNWHLADLEGNEASYSLAKHYFHQDGREIYDATLNGKLNIFPKIDFEDALKIARKKP